MSIDLTPWAGLVGVVVGVLLTAGIEEWRARRTRRWQREEDRESRVRELHVRQIAEARVTLVLQLERVQALATGDSAKIAELDDRVPPTSLGFIDLLGDETLIREYAGVLTNFYERVGTGLSADEVSRFTRLSVDVIRSLNRQEERVTRGEPLVELAPEVRDRLFDPKSGITASFEPRHIPPSVEGRMARAWLRVRSRLERTD